MLLGSREVTLGCDSGTQRSLNCTQLIVNGLTDAEVCYCDTDKCNGAVMTSSLGHVIITIALIISIVIGQLM